jgi:hypothetical protein
MAACAVTYMRVLPAIHATGVEMYRRLVIATLALSLVQTPAAQNAGLASSGNFNVKLVSDDTVYIDGGKDSGLAVGMALTIRRSTVSSAQSGDGQIKARVIVAKITVVSLSKTSAMCQVRSRNSEIHTGDLASMAGSQDKPFAEDRSRTTQAFAPPPGPLVQKTPVNVPEPLPITNGARTQAPEPSSLPTTASGNKPKSLPEQMAENAKHQHADEPTAATSGGTKQPETIAEIARRNRERGRPHVSDSTTAPAVAAAVPPASQPAAQTSAQPSLSSSLADRSANPATIAPDTKTTELTGPRPQPAPGKNASVAMAAGISDASSAKTSTAGSAANTSAATSAGATSAKSAPAARESSTTVAVDATPAKPAIPSPTSPSQPAVSSTKSGTAPASPTWAAADIPTRTSSIPAIQASAPSQSAPSQTSFNVKYIAADAVYIDGGKSAGLAEGMALAIKKGNEVVAELRVESVSNTSAVCEIMSKTVDLQRGDVAALSQTDQDKLVLAQTMGPGRKYPQVVAFSEGDPLDEEVREAVPKPPLPEVNRTRGRFGVDYTLISSNGSSAANTYQVGGVVRVDMTRIGGSYWNLNGYWRGRLNSLASSSQPQSVYDLVNRTYTIGFTYSNPHSNWVAGFGRQYLPWAPSLDTTDGGYLGRKVGSHVTVGAFAGTAPDPTSFNYNPDRRTAGSFVAMEGGSFEGLRFTSTEGIAVSAVEWREDRQFVFSENGLFYKRFLSIYHSAQADIMRLPAGGTTEGLARSFATLRVQPFTRFSIDVNHSYFRDVPTFDPALVGTGLLDKFLFQGLSVGSRLDLPGRISLYNNFGQSSKSGDAHNSFNQLYGLTLGRIWKTGLRGDVRYSKFNSSFGQGNYRAASLSRSFSELMRIEVTAGQQNFLSSLAATTNYRLLGSTVDLNLGGHYFVETGFNLQRSPQQNFDQWLMTMGYRFDTRRPR